MFRVVYMEQSEKFLVYLHAYRLFSNNILNEKPDSYEVRYIFDNNFQINYLFVEVV